MSDYDNTNSGVLFVNKYKEESDSRPDFVGTLDVDGRELRVAGWKNTSKGGKRYISLKVEEPREKSGDDKVPF